MSLAPVMSCMAAARSVNVPLAVAPSMRRAEQDRFRLSRDGDRHPRAIGKKLAHERVAARTTAERDGVDHGALRAASLDDLAQTIAEAENAGDVKGYKAVEIALHPESRDHRAGIRVGIGRAVAEKVRHDDEAAVPNESPPTTRRSSRQPGRRGDPVRTGPAKRRERVLPRLRGGCATI